MSKYILGRKEVETTAGKRSRWVIALSSIFALALAFLMLLPLFGIAHTLSQPVQAHAFAPILCGADIGVGMDDKKRPSDTLIESDDRNRKWTLQEAYGGGMNVVSFQGFGSGAWVETKEVPEDIQAPEGMDAVMGQFEEVRHPYTCTLGAGIASLTTLQIKLAEVITSFTNTVIGVAVSSDFSLVGIVGGESDSDENSLMSVLTRSIYTPLILFAVVAAAVSVAYRGIVQRRFRDAFGKALWVVGSAILGMVLLLFPYHLTQAPTILANSLASCVIGAFNGSNCLTGETTSDSFGLAEESGVYGNVCSVGSSSGSTTDALELSIASMGCNIWAAFVLEPYAEASFGTSYDELTTTDTANEELQQAISDAGLEPEAFCINLASSGSAADDRNSPVHMDGGARGDSGTVCNLAAYQMFLTHNTTPESANPAGGNAPELWDADERWYNIATVAAHHDGLWDAWTSNTVADFTKLNMGISSVLSSIVGSVLLIVVSFYALIYKVAGTLLIALAPLFLLFMIEPTRGRAIAAGWLGQMLSTVFKYLASVLFLLISLLCLSAVVASTGFYQVNVLLVIILSGALLMYRPEVVDMLGRVNMGNTVLTDRISERVMGTASLAGRTTQGGIGSKAAGGKFSEGFNNTLKQELAAGRGRQAFGDGVGGALQSGVLTAQSVQRGKQGVQAYQQRRHQKKQQQSGSTGSGSGGSNTNAPQQRSGSGSAPQQQTVGGASAQTGGTQQAGGASTQAGGTQQAGSSAPQQAQRSGSGTQARATGGSTGQPQSQSTGTQNRSASQQGSGTSQQRSQTQAGASSKNPQQQGGGSTSGQKRSRTRTHHRTIEVNAQRVAPDSEEGKKIQQNRGIPTIRPDAPKIRRTRNNDDDDE